MDYRKIWRDVLSLIEQNTTQASYHTWFVPAVLHDVDERKKTVYIALDGSFRVNLLKSRYLPVLEESFETVLGEHFDVVIKTPEEYEETERGGRNGRNYGENDGRGDGRTDNGNDRVIDNLNGEERDTSIRDTAISGVINLRNGLREQRIFNPRFSFDNFVVGNCNIHAHHAALAVAQNPSQSYNPLFIYGGSGLGKTHLIHAIGLYILEHRPDLNILYVSSEMFTNEFIKALGENKTREFKNKYRKLDVLMVDDIQFLGGKESTQEEFFNTFNTLYDNNKQIVISSDRSPQELDRLTQRLRSRFQWNIVASLSPADYETRVAILKKKAENAHYTVDKDMEEVLFLIAENITDNIRDLEGAFNRITGFSEIMKEHIDVAFARRILKDMLKNGGESVTPEKIKSVVSKYYNVSVRDLESSTRKKTVADPRQTAMYLCRIMTEYSFEKIGNLFGNRHYSTVMHACDKIQEMINSGDPVKDDIEILKARINE